MNIKMHAAVLDKIEKALSQTGQPGGSAGMVAKAIGIPAKDHPAVAEIMAMLITYQEVFEKGQGKDIVKENVVTNRLALGMIAGAALALMED